MNNTDFNTAYPINYTTEDLLTNTAVTIGIRHASGGVGTSQPIEVVLNIDNDLYSTASPRWFAEIIRTVLAEAGWLAKTSFDSFSVAPKTAHRSARHADLPTIELVAHEVIG